MILDRTWSKKEQKLIISYIDKLGNRQFYQKYLHHIKSYEYDSEEATGDVVDDAVYYKNSAVEDYLGINLDFVIEDGAWNNRSAFNGLIQSDVMSGSKEYDLVSGITVCTMPIAVEGYFLDGKSLPY